MHTPTDTSGVHVWLVLWRAYDALRAHAERNIEGQELGFSDFAALEALLHRGPLPVNTIGAKLGLSSGAISIAVDRLEARGLVDRRSDPADRRARVVYLTRAGRGVAQRAFARHATAMEHEAQGLNTAERAQLVALLKKLGLHARELLGS